MLHFPRIPALALAALLALAGPSLASAHAVVVESKPALNATVDGAAPELSLRFNSRIDHQRSRLSLIGGDGKTTNLDIAQDGPPDVIAAKGSALTPGVYKLHWQVLSVDGHLTRGDIPFTVKAP